MPWRVVSSDRQLSFVGEEMFFGKDQLRDVEESIVEQKGRTAKAG